MNWPDNLPRRRSYFYGNFLKVTSLAKRYALSMNMLGEALGVKSDWILEDSMFY